MKMKKIYYKAILRKNRSSAIIYQMGISVTYPVNEWAVPKVPNSKLMVFENETIALAFIGFKTGTYMIVKCHVKNPIKACSKRNKYPLLQWFSDFNYNNISNTDFIQFWRLIKNKDKRQDFVDSIRRNITMDGKWGKLVYINPPIGTIFCDAVYCLE